MIFLATLLLLVLIPLLMTPVFATDDTNYLDISYDDLTHDITFVWDFGDNTHRDGCYSKTEFYQSNYESIDPFELGDRDRFNFEGYDTDVTGLGGLTVKNVNIDNAEIDCQGTMIFNTQTTHPTTLTDDLELYMTFFQVIKNEHLSEYSDYVKGTSNARALNEAQVIIAPQISIDTPQCGALDPTKDEWNFVEFIYDINGSKETVYDNVIGCWATNITHDYTITTPTKKSGGGGCSDCTPPTLGLDNNGQLRVRDGIIINSHSEDGGYFHTAYPMQYTKLGETNHITLKYWENQGANNVKLVQLGIGVKEIGSPISLSQAIIEVNMDYFGNDVENPIIKEINIVDRDGIISKVNGSVSLENCDSSNGNNEKISDFGKSYDDREEFYSNLINDTCLVVDFEYSYDKVPESWVLMSNAIDYDRNTFNNYFNAGLAVIGTNPAIVTETVEKKRQCIDPIQNVMTRNNCNFQMLLPHLYPHWIE